MAWISGPPNSDINSGLRAGLPYANQYDESHASGYPVITQAYQQLFFTPASTGGGGTVGFPL